MSDPLEGYRESEDINEFSGDEQRLREILISRNRLFKLIDAGQSFAKFLETNEGRVIWDDASDALAQGIQAWLSTDDPGSREARLAHFNARVAVSVLQQFQRAIDRGREASEELKRIEDDEQ